MGSTLTFPSEAGQESFERVLSKLDFVMQTSSPNFGLFKVYKMRQKPYEYVMCKSYTGLVGTETLQAKKDKYSKYELNKSVIPFEYVDLKQVEEKCGRHLELNILCRYYFFTLQEAIQKRIKRQTRFPEEEILYTIKTLISLYDYFHRMDENDCGLFRTANIFLTPEGFLKIYPEINEWKREHIEETASFSHSIFSFATETQVELDLNKDKREFLEKKEKTSNDILDIGVVILSTVLSAKESDYRFENDAIRHEMIRFVLNVYSDPENRTLGLFKSMLKGIFEQAWKIEEIKAEVEAIESSYPFKNSNRIRILGSENEENEVTVNGSPYERQRESRLKMLPKNYLVAGRIECVSARTSCGSKI